MIKESTIENTNLPAGWEMKTLGEIGKVSMCKRILKKDTSPSGEIPFYKIGTFGKKPNAFISREKYEEFRSKYSFPKVGDILLSASGTIGRRVIFDGKPGYFQDSNIVWIDNNGEIVLNEFLNEFYGYCDWNPSKGATISRLYNDDLRRIKISYPKSKEEQKQIVSILDKAFAAIDRAKANAEQNLQNAKELFESYLQNVFENKGDDWEEKTLQEVCHKITDGSHNPPKGKDSGRLMASGRNITENGLDLRKVRFITDQEFEKEDKRTDVQPGDVLLTIVGTIGRSLVYPEGIEKLTFQRSVAVIKPKLDINSSFLSRLFMSKKYQDLFKEKARGAAQKGIYLKTLRSIIISLPPLSQQKQIVEKLDSLSAETKKLESIYTQKLADLEEMKKSILQKAFSGQLSTIN